MPVYMRRNWQARAGTAIHIVPSARDPARFQPSWSDRDHRSMCTAPGCSARFAFDGALLKQGRRQFSVLPLRSPTGVTRRDIARA